ncbi:hypothetical protein L7F22_052148 [Adiantum nelumboides]|nr:hypothetical protein [Adiantum nelumboides]
MKMMMRKLFLEATLQGITGQEQQRRQFVKLGDLEEPVLALVHSSYPLILGQPYIIAMHMEIKVLDDDSAYVSDEQIFFIQVHSSYPLILGQPYIIAMRMEIKVLDDGSAYARIQSKDGNVLDPDDVISGAFEEISYVDMMSELEEIKRNRLQKGTEIVNVHSMDAYEMLLQLNQDFEDAFEDAIDVQVETKYKTIAKKVKLMATPLPEGSNEVIEEAS